MKGFQLFKWIVGNHLKNNLLGLLIQLIELLIVRLVRDKVQMLLAKS